MWGGRWIFLILVVSAIFLKENSILGVKNLKIKKRDDFIENPRPRTEKYVPKLFLFQWRHYLGAVIDLKKVPKLRFLPKTDLLKNSIEQ